MAGHKEPGNFSESCGPCNIPENVVLPVDIFLCLFPNALFEHIVYETNLYVTQASAHTGKSFIPTNVNEMKSFFALNIIMGIKRLPSYRDFWSAKLELRCLCLKRNAQNPFRLVIWKYPLE
ncbi:hypothetical protein NQ314_001243 [Rhamnusium bicolor]|uniref:PiggyBac transposable element-derived protein domain-containing protein n=1 Tax=Rhamnusium bicolor TaxID=1586634 RepID=A0AAV8ZU47_9CUCU|nr:hypothetical protein NQ314_001243 [Rhamnusium bicolor]